MGDYEIDWSVDDTGYSPESQQELYNYLYPVSDAESGGFGAGTTSVGGDIYGGDMGLSSSLDASDLAKLFASSPALSGIAKTLGTVAAGKLADKLFGVKGGPGGYKGGIPTLTASRQQYAVPLTGAPSTYNPSDAEIRNYISRPGITDAMVTRGMNQFGITPDRIAGITGLTPDAVNKRYQASMGPNVTSRRPGSGGVTYFSPMQYSAPAAVQVTPPADAEAVPPENVAAPVDTPVDTPMGAANGGLMGYARGGIANLGSYSDGGRLLRGPGDGVSDSIPATIGKGQPARLADGEFVIPARIVSELGNGSTEAGARKLYAMMERIKKSRRKAKNIAADTKSDKHLPA